MAVHNDLGNEGEKRAQAYLRQKGYQIKTTNWHAGSLELDIVAEKNGKLIIVEVKTRSRPNFQHPKEAVTLKKIRRIVQATDEYIKKHNWQGETQFDVISIIMRRQKLEIEHIEDAFLPPVW